MSFKHIVGAVLLTASFATPVFAAEFFIVSEHGSKECRVVRERPTDTTTVIGDKTYITEEEAIGAVKTVCVDRYGF